MQLMDEWRWDFHIGLPYVLVILFGPITLAQSFGYLRKGIYTKTFKGTSRKEYIHKDARPIEYWFSIIFEFGASFMLIGVGLWLLRDIPAVNEWYAEIRAMLPY